MKEITFLDYIWIYGIVIVNVLFYARKFIIIKYGGKVSFFIGGYRDGKRLRKVTDGKISETTQRNYKILNIAIPTIFLFSLLLFLLRILPLFLE